MDFVLYDLPENWKKFLPFTFSRPVSEIRVGILTIREKWEKMLGAKVSYQTQSYLSQKFRGPIGTDHFIINSAVLPNQELVRALVKLESGESLFSGEMWVASRSVDKPIESFNPGESKKGHQISAGSIERIWQIFTLNGSEIIADFECITKNRKSEPISSSNRTTNSENIFLEPGAIVEHSILNASNGPIYIGNQAEVMEGCMIRGGFALGDHAVLKMGAKIYGPTTIGPHSKVGGEVNNSVIFGYSNKAHDGFLGNSVLGEWCNLGADTNNSNLKNNYSEVKVYDYSSNADILTGLNFCGLFMGDHSKAGINTMFNTGTVTGFSCNVFGAGFPDKHLPSFTWGGAESSEVFDLEKSISLAKAVYFRRNTEFSKEDESIFREIFNLTVKQKG